MKGAQIDYASYSSFMRSALSGPQICNKDTSLNHAYFNTKKGFYWSERHTELLTAGVIAHELDLRSLREQVFKNGKTEVELELRVCLLFGVKDIKAVTEKDLKEFRRANEKAKKSKE